MFEPDTKAHANGTVARWRSIHSQLLLAVLTAGCLVPFHGKAFHIDDTLFVWAAHQIARHPLDPYGFPVVWYSTSMPMAEVTMNPPGAAYYMAAIGRIAGWSETALHLAFLVPALIVVLGTYRLARRFTGRPLLAAAATLLTPGFLVSGTSVMCDTAMLALWISATIVWLEGLDRKKPAMLAAAAVMIAVCALTKYFGIALLPLLLVYTIAKTRRAGSPLLFFAIPILLLAAYEHGTGTLYGRGLLAQAADYTAGDPATWKIRATQTLHGLSFAGGCALPVLTFIAAIWSRRAILMGAAIAAAAGLWLSTVESVYSPLQLSLFIGGGISLAGLVLSDFRRSRDADSGLLALWVSGTFAFAAYVNWTVNARSLLPLIPAAGILLARRFDSGAVLPPWSGLVRTVAPLAASGIVSIWVTCADVRMADSARLAAQYVADHSGADRTSVGFEGHWGFQYYMERLGFRPVDFESYRVAAGKSIVLPENNTNVKDVPPQFVESQSEFDFDTNIGVTTGSLGAGFYSDVYGPLPFAFGRVPPERYTVVRLRGSGPLDPDSDGGAPR